jgi:hypothetical protein
MNSIKSVVSRARGITERIREDLSPAQADQQAAALPAKMTIIPFEPTKKRTSKTLLQITAFKQARLVEKLQAPISSLCINGMSNFFFFFTSLVCEIFHRKYFVCWKIGWERSGFQGFGKERNYGCRANYASFAWKC